MGLRAPQTPQAPKAPLPEFAAQRKKVEQRINADTQGQQEAMQRRFAAQGMLNSGAAIKQAGIVANQAQQNREDALGQVDAAEMGEMQRRQEVMDNRDFAANESKLGRDFQGQESAMARALQSGQFDRSFGLQEKDFARQGEQFDRNFAQQGSQFDRNFAQQGSQFDKQFGLQERGQQMQGEQFNKQFQETVRNNNWQQGFEQGKYKDERLDQAHNIAISLQDLDDEDYARYSQMYKARTGMPLPARPNQKVQSDGSNGEKTTWAQPRR